MADGDKVPTTSFMFRAVTALAAKYLEHTDEKTSGAVEYCIIRALNDLAISKDQFNMVELRKAIQPLTLEEEEELLIKDLLNDVESARTTIADKRRSIVTCEAMIRLALRRLNTSKALLYQLNYKGVI